MNQTLEQLLKISKDALEEIALVPCGGCHLEVFSCSDQAKPSVRTTMLSLPSLLSEIPVSRRRLDCAHAVITLSSCEQNCAASLLSPIRSPDAQFIAKPSDTPKQFQQQLQEKIGELCSLPLHSNLLQKEVFSLDYLGLKCPNPILQLASACKTLQPGQGFEIIADDLAFGADVKTWCRQSGIILHQIEQQNGIYTATVLKPESTKEKTQKVAQTKRTNDFIAQEVTEEIDFSGLKCPMPIIKLSSKVRKMEHGTLKLLADDPAFPADLEAWARERDATVSWQPSPENGIFCAKLTLAQKKSSKTPSPASPKTAQVPEETQKILATIDCMEMRSPLQIVALQKEFTKHVGPGLIQIDTKDPAFPTDIRNWCAQKEVDLVGIQMDGERISARIALAAPKIEKLGSIQLSISPEVQTLPTPFPPSQAKSGAFSLPKVVPIAKETIPVAKKTISEKEIAPAAKKTISAKEIAPIELDFRGLKCPMPILRLSRETSSSAPGSIFRALADDAAFPADIKAWIHQTKAQLLELETEGSVHSALFQTADPNRTEPAKPAEKIPEKPTTKKFVSAPVSVERLPELSPERSSVLSPVLSQSSVPPKQHPPFQILDTRGMRCPMPIMRLTQAHRQAPNEPFEIQADDLAFPADLKSWCDVHNFEITNQQNKDGGFICQIRPKTA